MLNHFLLVQTAIAFQRRNDALISLFDMLARKIWHLVGKLTRQGDRAYQGLYAVRFEHPIIVFAKGRGLVNQTSTAICGDIVIAHHHKSTKLYLIGKVGKNRLVGTAYQFTTL